MIQQPNMLPIFGEKLSTYQLAQEYVVDSCGWRFVVPAGLVIDGASAPWFAWSFGFLPDGLHRAGALVHDWLYALKGVICRCPACKPLTRKECDGVFHDLMVRAGVQAKRAGIMHCAVRWFGWLPWSRAVGPRIEPLRYQIS